MTALSRGNLRPANCGCSKFNDLQYLQAALPLTGGCRGRGRTTRRPSADDPNVFRMSAASIGSSRLRDFRQAAALAIVLAAGSFRRHLRVAPSLARTSPGIWYSLMTSLSLWSPQISRWINNAQTASEASSREGLPVSLVIVFRRPRCKPGQRGFHLAALATQRPLARRQARIQGLNPPLDCPESDRGGLRLTMPPFLDIRSNDDAR